MINVADNSTLKREVLLTLWIFYSLALQVPRIHTRNGRLKAALREQNRKISHHLRPLQTLNFTITSLKN